MVGSELISEGSYGSNLTISPPFVLLFFSGVAITGKQDSEDTKLGLGFDV